MKTVLLIEDDTMILEVIRQALIKLGYAVLGISNPREALSLKGMPIDLLVTDCLLGEMTGREIAEEFRRSNPGLKILFISGCPSEEHSIPLGQGYAFLHKPFSGKELTRCLQKLNNNLPAYA